MNITRIVAPESGDRLRISGPAEMGRLVQFKMRRSVSVPTYREQGLLFGKEVEIIRPITETLGQSIWEWHQLTPSTFGDDGDFPFVSGQDMLIVCLDDLADRDVAVIRLMQFRIELPETSVVILSKSFSIDDVGVDRLALCDICLKLPLAEDSMYQKIVKAKMNNRVWQHRLDELRNIIPVTDID